MIKSILVTLTFLLNDLMVTIIFYVVSQNDDTFEVIFIYLFKLFYCIYIYKITCRTYQIWTEDKQAGYFAVIPNVNTD